MLTSSQPKIRDSIKKASEDAYKKMIRTAYNMTMEPSLPSRQFKTLIKCQRENGIRLIDGRLKIFHCSDFLSVPYVLFSFISSQIKKLISV